MQSRVTKRDLENFAGLGAALPADPRRQASLDELVDGLVHVLETPSARLANSAVRVLLLMASRQSLDMLADLEMSDAARRRLGFLCDSLTEVVDDETSCVLAELAKNLYQVGDFRAEPVTFMAVVRPSLVRALKRRADEVNQRWAVYGGSDLIDDASSL